MAQLSQRSTIYFEPSVHKALRIKAAEESRSISDIIHEALSVLFGEDAEDIADFDARIGESNVGYDAFVHSLKADGII